MATKIQVRRDSSADWTTINPVLSEGEIGFETNTGKFKIGNGSSVWSSLDYFGGEVDLSGYLTISSASTIYATKTYADNAVSSLVDSAPSTLNTLNELAAALGDDANYASTITTALGNKLDISSASTTYQTKNIDIITAKTGAYTIASGDQNDLIELNGTFTVSIPLDSTFNFAIGTQINFLNIGTGVITFAAATPGTTPTGTTVNATPGLKLRAQWSSATLIKRAADTWVVVGDLTA
jgi:hypothetical protein